MVTRLLVFVVFAIITSAVASIIDNAVGLQMVGSQGARITHLVVSRLIGAGILFILFYMKAS